MPGLRRTVEVLAPRLGGWRANLMPGRGPGWISETTPGYHIHWYGLVLVAITVSLLSDYLK